MADDNHAHFEGKSALAHVVERRVSELSAAAEEHGLEAPSYAASTSDAARESGVCLAMLCALLLSLGVGFLEAGFVCIAFGLSYALWKAGRSAQLGWARLERLHRVIEQERFEIQNHRPQEREELGALYAAKGFEGRLLEEVLDVLMADDDRALRVMLLEELGLPLESYEHPLKQAGGAFLGASVAALLFCCAYFGLGAWCAFLSSALVVGASAAFGALGRGNRVLPAVVWSLALGGLAVGALRCILNFLGQLS